MLKMGPWALFAFGMSLLLLLVISTSYITRAHWHIKHPTRSAQLAFFLMWTLFVMVLLTFAISGTGTIGLFSPDTRNLASTETSASSTANLITLTSSPAAGEAFIQSKEDALLKARPTLSWFDLAFVGVVITLCAVVAIFALMGASDTKGDPASDLTIAAHLLFGSIAIIMVAVVFEFFGHVTNQRRLQRQITAARARRAASVAPVSA